MTPEFALKLGWAAGRAFANGRGARVLIGKDTRRSGYLFESALEAGLAAAGAEAFLLGPLPTPAVSYLTRALRADAGVVISASHNPHYDNGFKFFSGEGDKLSDDAEQRIEALLDEPLQCVPPSQMGRARRIDDAAGRYIEFCKSTFLGGSLKGLRIAVDCANGAAYRVGPAVLAELGADVVAIGDRPDGFNINRSCGSTDLALLRATVLEQRADIGIALDGDADRCLMVAKNGDLLDGDDILYIIVRHRQGIGQLRGPVVGTQMSNFGLEQAFAAMKVPFLRSKVGDRHVLDMLRAHDGLLGGETSGHTLCLDRARTGDGLVSALQVIEAMLASGVDLATLADLHKLPQVLINVVIDRRLPMHDVLRQPAVVTALADSERRLRGIGRVLLRPSGTEPLIRVMVEADDGDLARSTAEQLADQVRAVAAPETSIIV